MLTQTPSRVVVFPGCKPVQMVRMPPKRSIPLAVSRLLQKVLRLYVDRPDFIAVLENIVDSMQARVEETKRRAAR